VKDYLYATMLFDPDLPPNMLQILDAGFHCDSVSANERQALCDQQCHRYPQLTSVRESMINSAPLPEGITIPMNTFFWFVEREFELMGRPFVVNYPSDTTLVIDMKTGVFISTDRCTMVTWPGCECETGVIYRTAPPYTPSSRRNPDVSCRACVRARRRPQVQSPART
jgi:hypothetical protein